MGKEATAEIAMELCDACRDLYEQDATTEPHSGLAKFDKPIKHIYRNLLSGDDVAFFVCHEPDCEAQYARFRGERWVLHNQRI